MMHLKLLNAQEMVRKRYLENIFADKVEELERKVVIWQKILAKEVKGLLVLNLNDIWSH